MQVTVSAEDKGKRLDIFVTALYPKLSRAFVQRLCADGKVYVGGSVASPGYRLKQDDKVKIDYDASELDNIPDIELPIIYEDDNCIVINKPAGILTHAQGKLGAEASVATFLRQHIGEASGLQDDGRGGIVHRLDRATSGVIICAKNQAALSFLQKQFAKRKVKKVYVAIVSGQLSPKEAIVDMPIERNPKSPATFRVGVNGKQSVTRYKVLKTTKHLSLLELTPSTGRTHELRVHLSHIGHPILGDYLYGDGRYGERMYLHALSIEITLPGGELKKFTAPLPTEFNSCMRT